MSFLGVSGTRRLDWLPLNPFLPLPQEAQTPAWLCASLAVGSRHMSPLALTFGIVEDVLPAVLSRAQAVGFAGALIQLSSFPDHAAGMDVQKWAFLALSQKHRGL